MKKVVIACIFYNMVFIFFAFIPFCYIRINRNCGLEFAEMTPYGCIKQLWLEVLYHILKQYNKYINKSNARFTQMESREETDMEVKALISHKP